MLNESTILKNADVALLNPKADLETIRPLEDNQNSTLNEILAKKTHIKPITIEVGGILQTALIKYFGDRTEEGAKLDTLEQEIAGYKTCVEAGINTAEILAYGKDNGRDFCIVIYEHTYNVHDIVQSISWFLDILTQGADVIADFNRAGKRHNDTDSTNLICIEHPEKGQVEVKLIDFGQCTENPSGEVIMADIMTFMSYLAMRAFEIGTDSYAEAMTKGRALMVQRFRFES